jgi:hypothetical protein
MRETDPRLFCDPVGDYDSPESRTESIAGLLALITYNSLVAFVILWMSAKNVR